MASHVEGQPGSGLPDGDKKTAFGGSLRAKPLLTPKPFSLQRNTTIRSIYAPKTLVPSSPSSSPVSIKDKFPMATKPEPTAALQTSPVTADAKPRRSAVSKGNTEENSTSQPGDMPDSASIPKATVLPTPQPSKTSIPVSVPVPLTTTKERSVTDDKTAQLDVSVKEPGVTITEESTVKDEKKSPDLSSFAATSSVPASHRTEPKIPSPVDDPRDTMPPDAPQKTAVTLRRPKASTDISKPKDEEVQTKSPLSPTSNDTPSKAGSPADPGILRSMTRKRLSMEQTKKFESGGQPLPSQPPKTTRATKNVSKLPTPATNPEKLNPTTLSGEQDAEVLKVEEKEDRTGGSSIKRRISQLFDSSSRPEDTTKREEPPVAIQSNGSGGGVKDRIKNWVADTIADAGNILQLQSKGPTTR